MADSSLRWPCDDRFGSGEEDADTDAKEVDASLLNMYVWSQVSEREAKRREGWGRLVMLCDSGY